MDVPTCVDVFAPSASALPSLRSLSVQHHSSKISPSLPLCKVAAKVLLVRRISLCGVVEVDVEAIARDCDGPDMDIDTAGQVKATSGLTLKLERGVWSAACLIDVFSRLGSAHGPTAAMQLAHVNEVHSTPLYGRYSNAGPLLALGRAVDGRGRSCIAVMHDDAPQGSTEGIAAAAGRLHAVARQQESVIEAGHLCFQK